MVNVDTSQQINSQSRDKDWNNCILNENLEETIVGRTENPCVVNVVESDGDEAGIYAIKIVPDCHKFK